MRCRKRRLSDIVHRNILTDYSSIQAWTVPDGDPVLVRRHTTSMTYR